MLVHFPIAAWTFAAALDALLLTPVNIAVPGIEIAALSHSLLWTGSALALPTIAAGVLDFSRLPAPVRRGTTLAHHILWMGSAWTIFLLAGIFRARSDLFASPAAWPVVFAELAGLVCLIFGGRAAARVVFGELVAAGGSDGSAQR